MPKIKLPTKSPRLDMTPMVDLAFLLVTFFMLTTKFRPTEVAVRIPSSQQQIPIPDKDIITITIDKKGAIFFNMDNKFKRAELIEALDKTMGMGLSEDNKKLFSCMSTIGVPFKDLKSYLDMKPDAREKYQMTGIPIDSTSKSEFNYWLIGARQANPMARIAIKGDGDADFKSVKLVMTAMQSDDIKVNRFNLITSLEAGDAVRDINVTK